MPARSRYFNWFRSVSRPSGRLVNPVFLGFKVSVKVRGKVKAKGPSGRLVNPVFLGGKVRVNVRVKVKAKGP